MPNKVRGESEFLAGSERYVMRLTLGALAEIEDALGVSSLGEIGGKLKSLGTKDIAAVASALLRGGGHNLSPEQVLRLDTDLGTLIAAIGNAFDAVGLSRNADSARSTSASPRETDSARGDAESAEAKSNSPLAGTISSPSLSA